MFHPSLRPTVGSLRREKGVPLDGSVPLFPPEILAKTFIFIWKDTSFPAELRAFGLIKKGDGGFTQQLPSPREKGQVGNGERNQLTENHFYLDSSFKMLILTLYFGDRKQVTFVIDSET